VTRFVDSIEAPSAEEAGSIFEAGYTGWAFPVDGKDAWDSDDIAVIRAIGFEPLPIMDMEPMDPRHHVDGGTLGLSGVYAVPYSYGYLVGNPKHIWLRAWCAEAGFIGTNPPAPPEGDARQWAGEIEMFGCLVNLNESNGLPFATWVQPRPEAPKSDGATSPSPSSSGSEPAPSSSSDPPGGSDSSEGAEP
jgi:hypothetical protein